jgi:hypothetical protein
MSGPSERASSTARTARRPVGRVVVIVVAAIALSGCGGAYVGAEGRDPGTTMMGCVQPPGRLSGLQVLMAQAIRGATLIPCVRKEVDDWIVSDFDIGAGHVRIVLDHRPSGAESATIEVSPRCDTGDAREVSSEHLGVRRFDRDAERTDRYDGQRYYTYPDACTSLRFSVTGRYAGLRGAELTAVFGFVSRDSLDARIGEVTDRRLRLDPSGAS